MRSRAPDGPDGPDGPNAPGSPEERVMHARIRKALFNDGDDAPVRIGRYALVRRLGGGAQGTVWAAYDDKLDRRVAIKLLRDEIDADDAGRSKRLVREARSLARISHPNVVPVFEVDTCALGVYVVTEYVRGESLDAWLESEARDVDQILEVFMAAGRGLAAAHARGVIHRDFKPENVIVAEDGGVKVVDFGLARAVGPRHNPQATSSLERRLQSAQSFEPLTGEGRVVGTPVYAAPEQLRDEPLDGRCDQFAYCVALHEALYGALPFEGRSSLERAVRVAEGRLTPPPDDPELPGPVYATLRRGLSADPRARFGSMTALLEALGAARSTSVAASARPRARRVWIALGGVAILLTLAVALALSFAGS